MLTKEMIRPTSVAECINSLDVIRGISLLGILLMNITGFGLSHAYDDPTVSGGSTGLNLVAWVTNSMFFEGTMRGMFSMLFGAGIILFTNRSVESIDGVSVTDLYFRRLLWLFLFGIIHGYILLWNGEVLYAYSIIGMFAFAFRNMKPKHLIIGAAILLSISTALNVKDYFETKNAYTLSAEAKAKKIKGKILTKQDIKAIDAWNGIVAGKKPSAEKTKEDIAQRQKGYFSVFMYRATAMKYMHTQYMYRYFFWDIFAMMLLGMAFFRNGILKAARSNKYYVTLMICGYAIGLTTNYFETSYILKHKFGIIPMDLAYISYDFGRVFTTLGHIGLIMLLIRSGFLPFLQRGLAAVGQMAFTNYISQSIICGIFFLGFGFGMFGKLQRYELYYVVFSIWIFQLIISPIWLRHFNFGPLEWAWRSLTYWSRQPFKRTSQEN